MSKNIPQSRLMIDYDTNVDGVKVKKTLPFRVLVLGDFTKRKDREELSKRQIFDISNGIDHTLKEMKIKFDFKVPNFLSKEDGSEIHVNYDITSMRDFTPAAIVDKVAPLKSLVKLKEMLYSLAQEIDNNKKTKQLIEGIFKNKDELEHMKSQIPNLERYSVSLNEKN